MVKLYLSYIRPEEDQTEAGRRLLETAWSAFSPEPMPPVCRRAQGKPCFLDVPLHFSIAHSGRRVLCAVSDCPVGADVERLRVYNRRLEQRVLRPPELAELSAAASRTEAFFTLWTRKEAYLKLTGEGLSGLAACPVMPLADGCLQAGGQCLHLYTQTDGEWVWSLCALSHTSPEVTEIKA